MIKKTLFHHRMVARGTKMAMMNED